MSQMNRSVLCLILSCVPALAQIEGTTYHVGHWHPEDFNHNGKGVITVSGATVTYSETKHPQHNFSLSCAEFIATARHEHGELLLGRQLPIEDFGKYQGNKKIGPV